VEVNEHQKRLNAAVTSLRQSAVIASRSARSMELVFGKTNPDRALRRWTTPLVVKRLMGESVAYVKRAK
jgi:hypothetical protein